MNPSTNEVVDTSGMTAEQLSNLGRRGFIPVPPSLQKDAEEALAGKNSVKIPFDSKSSLAKWAKKVRLNQHKAKGR